MTVREHRTAFPRKTIDLLVESGICFTFAEARQKLREGVVRIGIERIVAGEIINQPVLLWCGKTTFVSLIE